MNIQKYQKFFFSFLILTNLNCIPKTKITESCKKEILDLFYIQEYVENELIYSAVKKLKTKNQFVEKAQPPALEIK